MPLTSMILATLMSLTQSATATRTAPTIAPWIPAMREVHAQFTGEAGTFAHFGDSITVTMAFWAPLPYARKNASVEMERAFQRVNTTMQPECWRDWKGPEYGSEGRMTTRWADENLDAWLRKLNPETALIMFGSNDLHSLELEEYETRLRNVVTRCLANGTVTILSTIPPRSGFEQKSAVFAEAIRRVARDFTLPLIDYHAEILRRRPNDWDGSMDVFEGWQGYDVPTLIARDGTHPSHPEAYRGGYSEEALSRCGFSLRNYMALMKYEEVIDKVLQPSEDPKQESVTVSSPIQPPNQPWFPKAPPLPQPTGNVVHVSTVAELFDAVQAATPGTTILVAEGHYLMPCYLEIRADNVTLRGASGKRERAVLDGIESQHGELVGVTACSGVTIADLTIQNIKWNGFKLNSNKNVQRVTIYNCIIHNIWQRGVKGVAVPEQGRDEMRPKDCRIQYCLFYNDRAKHFEDDPADTPENFGGNYIGGIDVMYPKNWIISDNVFLNIQGRTRGARGAIFLWHEAEGCVVERNIIVDCDTGIALGNSHKPERVELHCRRMLVRNNFVAFTPESGILADYTQDCQIVHNTIHHPDNRLQRLIRLVHVNDGLKVANNLLSGPAMRIETDSAMAIHGNTTQDLTGMFVDAPHGNLRLKQMPPQLVGASWLVECPEDIDGHTRGNPTTIGATAPE